MRARAFRAAAVWGALILAAAAMLLLRPDCLILKYTGFFCAGCGTQHMILALLRGNLSGAASENLFMLFALPVSGAYIFWETVRYIRGKSPLFKRKGFVPVLCGMLAAAGLFTLLRNLPGFSWLAPAWAGV